METYALGVLQMSLQDFEDMTPRQYYNKVKGFEQNRINELDDHWERTRILAWVGIMGKTKTRVKSHTELFPLPSERQKDPKELPPPMTHEEALELAKKWSKND